MNAVVVVVAVVLVVSVLIATMLFLRSVTTSPKQGYRRSLGSFRRLRDDRRAEGFDAGAIRVNRDDWAGTSTDLPG
ncbi:MAG TPA: hypothetical protein VER34_09030 [Mycobacterium sp.]|jgi:hypothetical protein|nr:hypothetical protein [Mycobacterium sp.]